MFVTMVIAALIVDVLFSAGGLIPSGHPTRSDIFSSVKIDYKLFTNILGAAIFIGLFALTVRRGATDPTCGMKVDRGQAVRLQTDGGTVYFCSEECLREFQDARRPAEEQRERTGVRHAD